MYKKYDKIIDELLSKMTLSEKIGQLNQICFSDSPQKMEVIKEMIRKGQVGSLILADSSTAGNDESLAVNCKLLDEYQRVAVEESPNKIPLIFGRDVIYGHRTIYPIPLAQSCSFNPELIEKCYSDIAEEASNDGINWTFTPMLDMCRDPRWGRIIECAGEDPFVAGKVANAVVKGCQGDDLGKGKLVACAKHYIGYGASEAGRDYHHTEISDYSLYNYYLPAFKSAIDSGVGTVMSSFNDINGENVSSSKYYMSDILRDYLGFDGFVISDWGAVEVPIRQGTAENQKECAEMSLNAGVDMDMVDSAYINNLETLVDEGKVSVETIDTAVERILCVKLAMGLFERPYGEKFDYDKDKHLRDARELAAESMVLLKNNGVLPLKKDAKIGLFGPFVNERRSLLGTWALDGDEKSTPTIYEAMRNAMQGGKLTAASNLRLYDNFSYISCGVDTVVLALGESHWTTGENHSISDISLYDSQIELINKMKALGKKVVGVFFCGRPMALEGVVENLDAVLYAWHSGSETANAVCDILFGDTVPSGKTPVTFPRRATHIPLYYNITASSHPVNGYYGDHPEDNYTDSIATPLYPFGFGLSYTEFEYKNLSVDKENISLENLKQGEKFKVSIDVSNIGKFDGKEIVQLYIRDKFASIMRPLRELKGYKKVFIKQNETENVQFELGYQSLGFYLENGDYTAQKGEFEIYVGENCLTKNKLTVKVN